MPLYLLSRRVNILLPPTCGLMCGLASAAVRSMARERHAGKPPAVRAAVNKAVAPIVRASSLRRCISGQGMNKMITKPAGWALE